MLTTVYHITPIFALFSDKFDYKELETANPIFAPIIFFSFTIIMTFILLSFMITIILEGFSEVQVCPLFLSLNVRIIVTVKLSCYEVVRVGRFRGVFSCRLWSLSLFMLGKSR